MAILVAGMGYIGAALLRLLAEDAATGPIVCLDNFFSTSRESIEAALPNGVSLVEGDVANPEVVERAFAGVGDAQTVYFLAAQPSAGIAMRDPETTERSNLVGARVLLSAAARRGARVVFGGSFRVYGDDLAGSSVDETLPYGRVGDLSHLSKIYVEQLARMLGVRFASVRLGVTYGRSPIMKDTPQLMTVPNVFCMRAARGLPLEVNEDRPMAFVHVDDAASALLAADALLRATDEAWLAVNAAPEVATIGQVARSVQALSARPVTILGEAASEATFAVRSRLSEWRPRRTLENSLADVLNYFSQ